MNEHRPILDGINLVVHDMQASVAFSRRLGVVPDVTEPRGAHHRTSNVADGLAFDFDSVAFAQQWDQGWPGRPGAVIGFKVHARDDVDRLFADLTGAGYRAQQAPYDACWRARYAVVEDPDGNAVGSHESTRPQPATDREPVWVTKTVTNEADDPDVAPTHPRRVVRLVGSPCR